MAEEEVLTFSAGQWIPAAVIRFLWAIPLSVLLISEIRHRYFREKQPLTFSTKWLEAFSLLCIICMFLSSLFYTLKFFLFFCTFSLFLTNVFIIFGVMFMGYYQIARLYLCFANEQQHSNKGYPKRLFIFMYLVAVPLVIGYLSMISIYPNVFSRKCAINDDMDFSQYPLDIPHFKGTVILSGIFGTIYLIWDITTLLLYTWKIYQFKTMKDMDQSSEVFLRITMILYKIITLTLFYEIMAFLGAFSVAIALSAIDVDSLMFPVIQSIPNGLVSFSISLAMYLMMDHNKDKYVQFLRILRFCGLHWICCKWRNVVLDQLKELDDDSSRPRQVTTTKETRTSVAMTQVIAK